MTETAIIPDGSRVQVAKPGVVSGPAVVLFSLIYDSERTYWVRMDYGAYEFWASADEVSCNE